MKKFVLILLAACSSLVATAQNFNLPTTALLKGPYDSIFNAVYNFIDSQKLASADYYRTDSVFESYANKCEPVKEYKSFLDKYVYDEIVDISFGMDYIKPYGNLKEIYIAIAGSHARTYSEESFKIELLYYISKNLNTITGMNAITVKKEAHGKAFETLRQIINENDQRAQLLFFKINAAYTECLAALDLQRMPDADRITIKKALWDITPHITNL